MNTALLVSTVLALTGPSGEGARPASHSKACDGLKSESEDKREIIFNFGARFVILTFRRPYYTRAWNKLGRGTQKIGQGWFLLHTD